MITAEQLAMLNDGSGITEEPVMFQYNGSHYSNNAFTYKCDGWRWLIHYGTKVIGVWSDDDGREVIFPTWRGYSNTTARCIRDFTCDCGVSGSYLSALRAYGSLVDFANSGEVYDSFDYRMLELNDKEYKLKQILPDRWYMYGNFTDKYGRFMRDAAVGFIKERDDGAFNVSVFGVCGCRRCHGTFDDAVQLLADCHAVKLVQEL